MCYKMSTLSPWSQLVIQVFCLHISAPSACCMHNFRFSNSFPWATGVIVLGWQAYGVSKQAHKYTSHWHSGQPEGTPLRSPGPVFKKTTCRQSLLCHSLPPWEASAHIWIDRPFKKFYTFICLLSNCFWNAPFVRGYQLFFWQFQMISTLNISSEICLW